MEADPKPPVALPTRHRVLLLLDHPRCPREIQERIAGSHRKQIETSLHRLAQDRMAECVTPTIRQSRMYRRTYIGDLLVYELTGYRPNRWSEDDSDDVGLRAFVQAGKYRRLVLRVVSTEGIEQTSKEIRKSVLPMYERIGANHVHQVLREFAQRRIAVRNEQHKWTLTELGKKLQMIELDGLPERPTINRPLWEKIELANHDPKGDDAEKNQCQPSRGSV